MGGLSIWHWLIVLAIVLLLFGGGRISGVMGDFAKGIKAFKKGLEDEPPSAPPAPPKAIGSDTVPAAPVKKDEASHP